MLSPLERSKIRAEIEKLQLENNDLRESRWRFIWGSIIVPLVVAGVTIGILWSTDFFNVEQQKVENARVAFNKDTASYNIKIRNLNDSLENSRRSLYRANFSADSIKRVYDLLALTTRNLAAEEKSMKDSLLKKLGDAKGELFVQNVILKAELEFDAKLGKLQIDSLKRSGKLRRMQALETFQKNIDQLLTMYALPKSDGDLQKISDWMKSYLHFQSLQD